LLATLSTVVPSHAILPTATIPPNATPVIIRPGAHLSYGTLSQGTLLDVGATARFVIFGQYGDLLSIGVFPATGQAEAPSIELDAPDGTIVGASDGMNSGAPGAVIPALTLPSTGLYELYVQTADPQATGSFFIRLTNDWILRDVPGGTLTPDTLAVGRLAQPADRQAWQIMLTAGSTFNVLAQPSGDGTLDPVIDVSDPQGVRLGVAHDFSAVHQAQTDSFTASATGLYTIRISAYVDASIGAYDVIVHLGSGSQ